MGDLIERENYKDLEINKLVSFHIEMLVDLSQVARGRSY